MDDEELVRMSTADMLIDLGFEVVEAGSAEDALQLLKTGTMPNLLITDHLMPGMNGADLARAARAIKPPPERSARRSRVASRCATTSTLE